MHNGKKVVALCTSKLVEQFHEKWVNRVIRELQYSGHYTLIFGVDSDMYYMDASDYGDASIFDLMSFKYIDMVLVFTESFFHHEVITDVVNRAKKAKIPVMSIGSEMPDCYNILHDTDSSFEKLVRHIVEYHGLSEVNFISGIKGNDFAERRLEIYKNVLDDNDILFEEERVGYGDFWGGPTVEVMKQFMNPERVPPEAIICANDTMAVAATDYLKEHGVKVPEEILVTGIDGIEEGIQHSPGITTAVRDDVNDAKKLVAIVNQILEGRTVAVTTEFEYHIQLSQSCGCQETHLFDADRVITKLNLQGAAYRSDLTTYRQMSEAILESKDDDEFRKVIEQFMPNDSFICLNNDLSITDGKENMHHYHAKPFTDKLQAIIKQNDKISYSECIVENMVPEASKDGATDKTILLLPIHFVDQIVGYMGVWREKLDYNEMLRVYHFLVSLDNSAAFLLSKKWDR